MHIICTIVIVIGGVQHSEKIIKFKQSGNQMLDRKLHSNSKKF